MPPDRRERVLFIVNVAWFFVSHRLALARGLRDAGYDVHVATTVTDDADRVAIRDAGLTLHELSVRRGGLNPASDLRGLIELRRVMRMAAPDLVHLVTLKPILLGGLLARVLSVRAIVLAVPGLGYAFFATGAWASVRRWLLLRGLRFVAAHPRAGVILQNADDRDRLLAAGCFRPEAVELIEGSGVDLAAFAATPEPVTAGAVRIVLPARMLREKGVREFVEAADELHRRGIAADCVLAGREDPDNPGGISASELDGWTARGSVRWIGHQDDVRDALRASHIVCLPSYGEGMPKALLEAAAMRRAIVTTDVPGCRSAVDGGRAGLLVPARDGRALADALARLIADPALREHYADAAHRLATERFSLEGVIRQTLVLYRRLLGPDGRRT